MRAVQVETLKASGPRGWLRQYGSQSTVNAYVGRIRRFLLSSGAEGRLETREDRGRCRALLLGGIETRGAT